MSDTHKCEVVRVFPKQHPNPKCTKLDLVEVYGYTCCVQKGQFEQGQLAIYIPPDSVVPQKKQFEWLWEDIELLEGQEVPIRRRRIKAKKLQGVASEGLLIPISDFGYHEYITDSQSMPTMKEGQDVASIIGVTHYEPPCDETSGDSEKAPCKIRKKRYPKTFMGWVWFILDKLGLLKKKDQTETTAETASFEVPIYDLEPWQKHRSRIEEGEEVLITEKIHGENSRFTWMNDRLYCGSHYQWKKNIAGSRWWECVKQNPWIESFCKQNPGLVMYGELVPTQKRYNYGQKEGKFRLFGFDVYKPAERRYLSYEELQALPFEYIYGEAEDSIHANILHPFHWVPTIKKGPYTQEDIRQLSVGQSLVPGATNIREGIVIRTIKERKDYKGRICFKLVSTDYLEKD
jgi:hypothetical protein